ncbi:MAG TPA: beta-galactosidase [Gammaproteobacteria bacterium]|nr:beta-galactosidase [Gammaproteobacteria bacterium]
MASRKTFPRTRSLRPLGLLALAAAPALTAAEAPPESDFRYGIVAYHVPYPSFEIFESDLASMAEIGINWISVDLSWKLIEPEPDAPFDFSYFDALLGWAEKYDIQVLGKLGAGYNVERAIAPEWTQDLDGEAYLAQLDEYANATVQRYAHQIDSWGLENEINISLYHYNNNVRAQIYPEDVQDRILQTLSAAVRRHDTPEAEVIMTLSPLLDWQAFLRRIEGKVDYDTVGLFHYPSIIANQALLAPRLGDMIRDVRSVANGRPVVVMETGYHTAGALRTEARQALYVWLAIQATAEAGGTGIFFYHYLENPDEPLDRQRAWGLVTLEREPKAGWLAYELAIAADLAARAAGEPATAEGEAATP